MNWDELEQALAAGDRRTALLVALEGWRRQRHSRFADLVDFLGRDASPFRTRGSFHAEWLAAAATVDDVGPLAATVTRSWPEPANAYRWPPIPNAERYAAWIERVEALGRRREDPRIAAALLQVVAVGHWPSMAQDWEALVEPAMKIIVRTGDRRSAERMRSLLEKPIAKTMGMRRLLTTVFPAAIEAIEKAPPFVPLEEEELARVDGIVGPAPAARSGDDEALFALVVADLENDAPRAVLADHWLERGDVRGELVTKQLAGQESSARKYEKEWLGELAMVTKNRVWRRGFLAEIELANQAAADPAVWETARASRELQTVERIEKGKANEQLYASFVERARGLRTLIAPSKAMATAWAAREEPWPVTRLELAFAVDVKTAKAIAESRAFPRLVEVGMGVKAKGTAKLMAAAEVFAKRGIARFGALPLGAGGEELAEFMSAPLGEERWVRTSPTTRIVARSSDAGLRVEVTCEYLRYTRNLIEALRLAKVPIAEVALRLPRGITEPHPYRDKHALEAMRGLTVVADEGWAKVL